MADFASYTHKWRATPATTASSYHHQTDGNKVNKRNRQPVSCAPCRSRKLKCDRGHPCDACVKRHDQDSCVYGKVSTSTSTSSTAAAAGTRRGGSDEQSAKTNNVKAQERLRQLEELVKQMIGSDKDGTTATTATPHTPPTEERHQPEGSLNKDVTNGTSYTGSTHWATVLDQIQELRNTLSPTASNEDFLSTHSESRMDTLFSASQPPPMHVILSKYLPSREECNRYFSTYFNTKYVMISYVHAFQFRRQYEAFWDNQLEVTPIWLSMLFSILCAADTIRRAPLSIFKPQSEIPRTSPFLTASAQCLVLGDFAKPQPWVVEALAMHAQCKYAITLDPSHELGLIFSILARQAYTMGYHREPSVFKGQFTPFESEMRRRTWNFLRQFDLMVSFQLGLPVIMAPDSSDTRPPIHLLDEDFDEDTLELPPPRPMTEPTQMLYLITKARLMETYSKVCQHTLTFPKQPFTAADITKLDTLLTQTVESIPQVLRVRPMHQSYADPSNIIMIRNNLMYLGEKARCVLHRKYMVSGPNADDSRQKCIDSATRTISHFLDMHAELQPGGQLYHDRWMLTSFTINDFLLALMVLCLAFSLGRKKFIANGGVAEQWLDRDEEALRLYKILDRALPVCAQYGTRAKEARHVAEALGLVLVKLKPNEPTQAPSTQPLSIQHDQNHTGAQSQSRPISDVTGATNNHGAAAAAAPEMADSATLYPTTEGFSSSYTHDQRQDSEKMPVDIMPLSIHSGGGVGNEMNSAFQPYSANPLGMASASSSAFDFAAVSSASSVPTGPLTFSSASGIGTDPTDPSPMAWPSSSSWEMPSLTGNGFFSSGPLPNMLEGPEQIDWVQFDQFLSSYGVSGANGNDSVMEMEMEMDEEGEEIV